MRLLIRILWCCLFVPYMLQGQENLNRKKVLIKGSVTYQHSTEGIRNVRIQELGGSSVYSNYLGDFSISCTVGNELEISHQSFETRYVLIKNNDRIRVEVERELIGQAVAIQESEEQPMENKSADYRSKSFLKKNKNTHAFENYMATARSVFKIDPSKSILFIEKALASLQFNNTAKEQSEAYRMLGDAYVNLNQLDLGINSYKTAIEQYSTTGTRLKLAQVYATSGMRAKSSKLFIDLLKDRLTPIQKMKVQEGLGDNLSIDKDLRKAANYYEKSLQIAKDLKNNQYVAELNSKIGMCKDNLGNPQGARLYFQASLESAENINLSQRATVTNTIANHYKVQENFDKEIEFRSQALEVLSQRNVGDIPRSVKVDQVSISSLNFDIGKAYVNKKAYKMAIPFLEKSKFEAKEAKNVTLEKRAVENLSNAYKNIGDYKKALSSYQEYVLLVDALYKQKEAAIKAAVSLGKDLTNKQNRINSLEKDRELVASKYSLYAKEQELTVESYKRQRMIIYSLIAGLFLMLLSLFFMYRSNKQRKMTNNLLALKSLRSQMNPHFIFNALNSVNSFIAQNDERAANRYLTEFSKLMRNVLNNSEKDFIVLADEIELLELYLRLEHQRFEDKFEYELTIDPAIQTYEFQIPPMLLQPYIENAVWHGLRYKKEAGKLVVSMAMKDKNSIEILITDNGIGRSESKRLKTKNQKKQESKGMNNIKERIAILNDMYGDKVMVTVSDLLDDGSGTKVLLILKKN